MASKAAKAQSTEPAKLGRKRDSSRDADILEAVLELLIEVGYEGLTMDGVAARAKAGKATVYRRWPSKPELLREAIGHLNDAPALDELPDTGTLRGDLMALIKPQSLRDQNRRLQVMMGLSSVMAQEPELADAGFNPWIEANRVLIERALERGEFPAGGDVQILSQIIPSMIASRTLIRQTTVDRKFIVSAIDSILLPALRGARTS